MRYLKILLSVPLLLSSFYATAAITIDQATGPVILRSNLNPPLDNLVELKDTQDGTRRTEIYINGVLEATTPQTMKWAVLALTRGSNTVVIDGVLSGRDILSVKADSITIRNADAKFISATADDILIEDTNVDFNLDTRGFNVEINNITGIRSYFHRGVNEATNLSINGMDFLHAGNPSGVARFNIRTKNKSDSISLFGINGGRADIRLFGGGDDISIGGSTFNRGFYLNGGAGFDSFTDTFPNAFNASSRVVKIEFFDIVAP